MLDIVWLLLKNVFTAIFARASNKNTQPQEKRSGSLRNPSKTQLTFGESLLLMRVVVMVLGSGAPNNYLVDFATFPQLFGDVASNCGPTKSSRGSFLAAYDCCPVTRRLHTP